MASPDSEVTASLRNLELSRPTRPKTARAPPPRRPSHSAPVQRPQPNREAATASFDAWAQRKAREIRAKRATERRERRLQEESKSSAEERRLEQADSTFQQWLERKRQRAQEKRRQQKAETEALLKNAREVTLPFIHSDTAYQQWLARKQEQKTEEKETERVYERQCETLRRTVLGGVKMTKRRPLTAPGKLGWDAPLNATAPAALGRRTITAGPGRPVATWATISTELVELSSPPSSPRSGRAAAGHGPTTSMTYLRTLLSAGEK
eukprot:m.130432 g.130432  ORF g.130432 m.130432 type:complete len:266 (+) comp9784_c1_seq8:173-970(+)